MYHKLLKSYWEESIFSRLPVEEMKSRQVLKFRCLFEHARAHSVFYRDLYHQAGVSNLVIRNFSDIEKVPIVDKDMMRKYDFTDLLTCPLNDSLNLHITSGSTGTPFRVYQNKFEDYTAHFRVLFLLRSIGYQPWHKITMITRYEPDEKFQMEQDLSLVSKIQRYLKFFRRQIFSIYEDAEILADKVAKSTPYILWSTPSVLELVANVLLSCNRKLNIPYVVLTSETVQPHQYEKFHRCISNNIVSHYGLIEAPTIAFRINDGDYRILGSAFLLESLNPRQHGDLMVGTPVVTNLVNFTMPFIRYNTNDVARVIDKPEFPQKILGNIDGRNDDILSFPDGNFLVHHHVTEMFMTFEECAQYKFEQTPNGAIRLLIVPNPKFDAAYIENKARERWNKRFKKYPLNIEFRNAIKPDSKTGKVRNIEKLRNDACHHLY